MRKRGLITQRSQVQILTPLPVRLGIICIPNLYCSILFFSISAYLRQIETRSSMVQSDTDGRPNCIIRENRLHPSLRMTAPFMFSVSYGFGLLYFVEFGLHGLIISGQSSYGYVLCLVVGQTKLVLGT